jgi:hypothetical protein
MTTLNDALTQLADVLHLDAADLIRYAAEDTAGGRGTGFSGWAIDPDEGRILYALVRALRPAQVVEIGVNEGASSTHLLAALAANNYGRLDSYDTDTNAGLLVPDGIHADWELHIEDATLVELPHASVVFEDADHSLAGATAMFTKLKALSPQVLVTHDVNMTTAHGDFYVGVAFADVFPDGFTLTLDGCERGLGVWVNPEYQPDEQSLAAYRAWVLDHDGPPYLGQELHSEEVEEAKPTVKKVAKRAAPPRKKPTTAKAGAKR